MVEVNRVVNIYKDAAGIWHEDRFRPLVAAIVNVGLNVLTVRWIGVFGVIFSTVIAVTVVELPWLIHNLFRLIFPREYLWTYVRKLLAYFAAFAAVCAATYGICVLPHLELLPTMAVRFLISLTLPNLLFPALYRRTPEFQSALEMADRLTKGRVGILKRLRRREG